MARMKSRLVAACIMAGLVAVACGVAPAVSAGGATAQQVGVAQVGQLGAPPATTKAGAPPATAVAAPPAAAKPDLRAKLVQGGMSAAEADALQKQLQGLGVTDDMFAKFASGDLQGAEAAAKAAGVDLQAILAAVSPYLAKYPGIVAALQGKGGSTSSAPPESAAISRLKWRFPDREFTQVSAKHIVDDQGNRYVVGATNYCFPVDAHNIIGRAI